MGAFLLHGTSLPIVAAALLRYQNQGGQSCSQEAFLLTPLSGALQCSPHALAGFLLQLHLPAHAVAGCHMAVSWLSTKYA